MCKLTANLCLIACIFLSPSLLADDKAQLASMLNKFLSGADVAEQHQRFWADDLIYTSSSGSRFGKAEIMAGFSSSESEAAKAETDADEDETVQSYGAEDVDIRLFGSSAVVAFKLVGTSSTKGVTSTSYYFNTGTFIKRKGQWQAVAWQATKIPPSEE